MTARSGRPYYAGLLVLALGALAVDRWILAAPKAVEPALPAATAEPAPVGDARGAPSIAIDLARRIESLRTPGLADGPLPETFVRFMPPATPAIEESTLAPAPTSVSATLVGVRPAAIVAGRTVALGAEFEGWTVLEISRSAVVFGRDGAVVERPVR